MSDKSISDTAIAQLAVFGTEKSGTLSHLAKDSHSKNITLADWNEFIHSSDLNLADVKRLYEVLKEAIPALETYTETESYKLGRLINTIKSDTEYDFRYKGVQTNFNDLPLDSKVGNVYTVIADTTINNVWYGPKSTWVKVTMGTSLTSAYVCISGGVPHKSIVSSLLGDNVVTKDKIADSAVTEAKLLSGSVSNAKIKNRTIMSSKIATEAIHGSAILDKSTDTTGVTHIYPGSIGNIDIADSIVGTSKIVNDAITTAKIKNGDVIESKLSENLQKRLTTFGGAFTNVEYNGTTGDLTFTKAESADVVKINLPLEQVITGGRYDKESNEIVFTIQNSDDQIKIPLNEFSKILIDDVEEDFNTLKEDIAKQHQAITDSINAIRDSIFEVQIAPPLERLVNAMVLPSPTLSMLANIE